MNLKKRAFALLAGLLLAGSSAATTFIIDGIVQTCNPIACAAAGINVGDPLGGYMTADSAVAGPNSTFTDPDIPDYLLTVGGFSVGVDDAVFDTGTFTTDGAGEIVSGSGLILGDVSGNAVEFELTISGGAGTWQISTEFLGLGVVSTGTLGFSLAIDTDADDVADFQDNCQLVINTDQVDTDADGIGNACDADLNGDCGVNFGDLALLKSGFFPVNDPNADFTGDGLVNFGDLVFMKATFFNGANPGPGPGLPGNACEN